MYARKQRLLLCVLCLLVAVVGCDRVWRLLPTPCVEVDHDGFPGTYCIYPEAHPSRRSSNGGPEDAVEMADIGMAVRTAEDPVQPSGSGIQRAGSSFLAKEVFVQTANLYSGGGVQRSFLLV
jgi:hypothetical protein